MATIPPVLPPAAAPGVEASVELHYGSWWHVARGVFRTVENDAVAFDGRTELPPLVRAFVGNVPDELRIEVILLASRNATSGRASVRLNDLYDEHASFTVDGGRYALTVNLGAAYTFTFERVSEETRVRFQSYELRLFV